MRSHQLRDIPRFTQRAKAMVWPDYFARQIYPLVRKYTFLRYETLRSLYKAAHDVTKRGVSGCAVECGVARGGSGATIAAALNEANRDAYLYLFDTFEGLPAPTRENPDYERAVQFTGECRGGIEEVEALFSRMGLRNYRLIKGMFQDTLPATDTGDISLLHIDGDWYESTRCCLENLWDRISEGGIVQIDDYGEWQGCKKAVDEFFSARAIPLQLHYIDPSARWLVKSHHGTQA
jgi:O-methyltransferase